MIAESPSPETPATASQPSAAPPPPSAPAPQRLPAYRWVLEGLRAAAFLTPRTGMAAPTPLQLLVLLAANWGWCCGANGGPLLAQWSSMHACGWGSSGCRWL